MIKDAKSGHMATVVASYGTYIPALGPRVSQGGVSNGEMWAGYSRSFGSKLSQSNYYWMMPDSMLDRLYGGRK